MIDPHVQGGSPCMTDTDVRTEVLAQRFLSGETVDDLARACGRTVLDIEEAIRYELAAAA